MSDLIADARPVWNVTFTEIVWAGPDGQESPPTMLRFTNVRASTPSVADKMCLNRTGCQYPSWGIRTAVVTVEEADDGERWRLLPRPSAEEEEEREADAAWAKPDDQPATGPLRRKLALARGVLMQVLDAKTIGGGPMPTRDELLAIVKETADP